LDYDTDKVTTGLLAEYQSRFAHLRDRPVKLLELGVARGGSLRFWADHFRAPETRIVGVDRALPDVQLPAKVALQRCDQMDRTGLSAVANAHGPFDIVVDDASHRAKETRRSFEVLWPHVAVGGTYVIEDWAVGYWPKKRRYLPRLPARGYRGMVQVVTGIVERVPALQIESFEVLLAPHKAMAFFRKGEQGWTS
jgi:cephalosporin hydroxylase